MLPSLRLGVELPPVPTGSADGPAGVAPLEPWWQLALASVSAGAGVVWFTGGPTAEDPGGLGTVALTCDACTIAAAAVTQVDSALLGVVSEIPVDRHPAVLARDVTALDVVSGGRAAVLLRWGGTAELAEGSGALAASPAGAATETRAASAARAAPEARAATETRAAPGRDGLPRGLSAACEHLGEAVAVCRSVLQDDDPVFEGRYLHVAGAVNRPPPRRPGGPPLFVEAPAAAVGLTGREAGPAFLLGQASSSAAAIVCSDDPGEVASWRALLDEAGSSLWEGRDPGEMPAVVCRTTLSCGGTDQDAQSPLTGTTGRVGRARAERRTRRTRAQRRTRVSQPATVAAVRSRLEAARRAGAGGVIVRVQSVLRGGETHHLDASDPERVVSALAERFEPWLR